MHQHSYQVCQTASEMRLKPNWLRDKKFYFEQILLSFDSCTVVNLFLIELGYFLSFNCKLGDKKNYTSNKFPFIRPEDTERYLNEQKERFTPFITEVQINSMAASNVSNLKL